MVRSSQCEVSAVQSFALPPSVVAGVVVGEWPGVAAIVGQAQLHGSCVYRSDTTNAQCLEGKRLGVSVKVFI